MPADCAAASHEEGTTDRVTTHRVVIVGTGFSGLCMAIRLKQAGIDDFVLLEKASEVGGTWRENHYPGAACDVPSHLYCYSFEPKPDWSRMFAPQPEILGYLRHCATKYGIRRHIRFETEALAARFDERERMWEVKTRDGARFRSNVLVQAKGALHIPSIPKLEGASRFEGPIFHSARWRHDVDLTGKRVAVIGSGASAIQIVPAIAGKVKELHYYQRTPPWVLPRNDREYSERERRLFAETPVAAFLHRQKIYWSMEPRVLGFSVAPKLMSYAEAMGRKNIARHVKDPALREKLTPKFTMGCKRTLISDDYYQALVRPNVEVITDGIGELTRSAIVTKDGEAREVDVVIYCTGFAVTDLVGGLDVEGRGGLRLAEAWKDRVETYLGVTTCGFPNFFMLMGPNTGLGHNSMVHMIESQSQYTLEAIRAMEKRGLRTVELRPEVARRCTDEVQARLRKSVWASGCQSWYLDEEGRNHTTWPGFTFEYRLRALRFDARDYATS